MTNDECTGISFYGVLIPFVIREFVILFEDSFTQPILFAVQNILREAIAFSVGIVMKLAKKMGDAETGGVAKVIREFANFG